jgi:hypothetical protein
MKNIKICMLIIGLAVFYPLSSFGQAENPDDPGETSTGSADISVGIPPLVKISNIANLTFESYTGHPDGITRAQMNRDVCIYSNLNTGGGSYSVTLTGGSNPADEGTQEFYIGSADTNDEIPYRAWWNPATGTGAGTDMTHNVAADGFGGFSNSVDCDEGDNANFSIAMEQADLLAVRTGTYTGTLTILIEPDVD